jgi:hypothetical protein
MNPAALTGVAQRIARRAMTDTATVYRPTEAVDANSRLLTTLTTVATGVPIWVERSMLSPVDDMGTVYEARVAQYVGHVPVGTDVRRNDVVVVDSVRYRVLGTLSGPTHSGEMRLDMDIAAHDGDTMP